MRQIVRRGRPADIVVALGREGESAQLVEADEAAPGDGIRRDPDDARPTSRPILWLIGFFSFLNVYSIQAVLPLLMEDLNVSAAQAGATVGATVLAIALVSPVIGVVSDALARRPSIGGGPPNSTTRCMASSIPCNRPSCSICASA